jgi:hypothetical protein
MLGRVRCSIGEILQPHTNLLALNNVHYRAKYWLEQIINRNGLRWSL